MHVQIRPHPFIFIAPLTLQLRIFGIDSQLNHARGHLDSYISAFVILTAFLLVLDWHYFFIIFAFLSLLLLLYLFGCVLCPFANLLKSLEDFVHVVKFIHLLNFNILLLHH